jgi:hypothetical protein
MDPAELAGMLAREVDAGIAIALSSVEAAGVLTLDRVTARIGAAPEGDDVDWSQVTWQSEVVLRIEPGRPRPTGTDAVAQGAAVPEIVAALPARALLGVGAVREAQLARAGIRTVGQLASLDSSAVGRLVSEQGAYAAELAARARQLPAVWPPDAGQVVGSRSVLDVVRAGPERLGGTDRVTAAAVWEACLRLAACLDASVLAALPARGLT